MKFKKVLALSAGVSVALTASIGCAVFNNASDVEAQQNTKTIRFEPLPDLKFVIDTLYFTNENFDAKYARSAAGQFVPGSNTVRVSYFACDDSANSRVKYYCNIANESIEAVRRHEMEHARKAHIVQDVNHLSRWDRARLAVMNEAMAPGGEIIEAVEYHIENGERYPQDRAFLWRADSLIMARHKEKNFGYGDGVPVDFSDPVIADIVLESAVNKFARDHKRGFYHTKIKKELSGVRRPKYKPHNKCDLMPTALNYIPMVDQWGVLWTYDVKAPWTVFAKNSVDIWNSATEETRRRVINKVDSIVKTNMTSGEMLNPKTFEYPY
ncbi:MAG: hypothetical protein K2I81_00860 [Alphaproteobacteria bacterium]|nr:hypothetical protein [Alphaproteobacteria bacterium]